jgi:hypothetical protein
MCTLYTVLTSCYLEYMLLMSTFIVLHVIHTSLCDILYHLSLA